MVVPISPRSFFLILLPHNYGMAVLDYSPKTRAEGNSPSGSVVSFIGLMDKEITSSKSYLSNSIIAFLTTVLISLWEGSTIEIPLCISMPFFPNRYSLAKQNVFMTRRNFIIDLLLFGLVIRSRSRSNSGLLHSRTSWFHDFLGERLQ